MTGEVGSSEGLEVRADAEDDGWPGGFGGTGSCRPVVRIGAPGERPRAETDGQLTPGSPIRTQPRRTGRSSSGPEAHANLIHSSRCPLRSLWLGPEWRSRGSGQRTISNPD